MARKTEKEFSEDTKRWRKGKVRANTMLDQREWMPDTSRDNCLLCEDAFSFSNRRHHCRQCGVLVCQHCSTNTLFANDTVNRICDLCYTAFSPIHENSLNQVNVFSPDNIAFCKLFYDWVNRGRETLCDVPLDAGLLYVRIIKAKRIPRQDYFGSCDAYCTFRLLTNGKAEKYKTQIKYVNLNPVWNHATHIPVENSTGVFEIQVWDHDYVGADDYIGKVRIPLQEIKNRGLCTFKKKFIDGNPDATIYFSLQYDVDPNADWISQFDQVQIREDPQFELNKTVKSILDFVDVITVLVNLIKEYFFIILWYDWVTSGAYLFYVYYSYYMPWLTPVMYQLVLVNLIKGGKFKYELTSANAAQESMDKDHPKAKNGGQQVKGTWLVEQTIYLLGYEDTLAWLEILLRWLTAKIAPILDLLNNKNEKTTNTIIISLFSSALLSFFSETYCNNLGYIIWLLIAGYFSPVMQALIFLQAGLSAKPSDPNLSAMRRARAQKAEETVFRKHIDALRLETSISKTVIG